jgi:hypothetical protein
MSEDAIVAEEVEDTELAEVDAEAVEVEETPESEEKAEDKEAEPSDSSPEKKDKGQEKIDKRIGEYTKVAKDAQREAAYWKNLAQTERIAPVPVEGGKTLSDF